MRCYVVLAALALTFGLPPPAGGAEAAAFAATPKIESELKRGVSLKEDVQKLLGDPQGDGECFLPGQDEPREVWYYSDIEITGYQQGSQEVFIDMRQQILLVFFKGDKFDGYLWTSNALSGKTE